MQMTFLLRILNPDSDLQKSHYFWNSFYNVERKLKFETMDITKGFDRLHLSKKLGEEHPNKDFMKSVRQNLREKPVSHLSPLLWSQINGVFLIFLKTLNSIELFDA